MSTERVLKEVWGFEELRPLQRDIVESAIAGRDALAIMPTGGGKSLCYQLPPLVAGGLTVVVSPLISLMKDQVDGLKLLGYPAEALNSNLDEYGAEEVCSKVLSGATKLLYVSPEKLLTPSLLNMLNRADSGKGVARIAIDEAHCISQWGHDFRPEYRQLKKVRELFPNAPVHAFTATATPRVREDIIRQLAFRESDVYIGVFDRPNLTYRIVPKDDPVRQILEAVTRHPDDAAIVYCISRKDTERTAAALAANGVKAEAYHAGLDANQRRLVSERFAQEQINVVVATVAFGMGIDRSNVRVVIHESMPKSIEGYQQETGRAGRDGLPSECLMLYAPNDYMRWERVIRGEGDSDFTRHQIDLIEEVRRFAVGTTCRHKYLSEYFGQQYAAPDESGCGACDLCLEGWTVVPNSTRIAHQIIATINMLNSGRPGAGFGAGHVAQVLTGANTKAIRQFGHDSLKAYGKMSEFPAAKVTTWMHQLVDQGLLTRQGSQFPTLHVSGQGQVALRNREEITMRDVALPVSKKSKNRAIPDGYDPTLFEALRDLRRQLALVRAVPAYVIFQDSVLMALSATRPTTVEGFSSVPGVGAKKAQDFGPAFIQVIENHVRERGLASDARVVKTPAGTATLKLLAPLFEAGASVEEAAASAKLAPSTVYGYLSSWIEDTAPASIEAWVDAATYGRVVAAANEHGDARLKPIFEALRGEVTYEQIRVALAAYRVGLSSSTDAVVAKYDF